jgi:two-component system NarL family response regulator
MNKMFPIRILIADDHPMIRTALKTMIEREPNMEVAGEAKNGLEAVKIFGETRPHITLMDINMPIMDGLEAIKVIRSKDGEARIIVLTNYDTDDDVQSGLAAGAMGYLLKDTTQDKLLNTIRAVHAGERVVPKQLLDKIAQRRLLPSLSPREISVLRLMMAGRSNRAIGLELGITESTVKSHVKNILIKMGVNDRTQAVTQAVQRGILRLDE